MFKLLSNVLALNKLLGDKVRAQQLHMEGMALHDAGQFKQALELLREASELGNEKAMCLLGSMYLLGEGTPENGREALRWLEKSLELGYEEASSLIGMAYATGKAGIKIDLEKGRSMIAEAAKRGDPQAAKMLGMIDRGEGMFGRLKKKRR